jgi:hypothetical protein
VKPEVRARLATAGKATLVVNLNLNSLATEDSRGKPPRSKKEAIAEASGRVLSRLRQSRGATTRYRFRWIPGLVTDVTDPRVCDLLEEMDEVDSVELGVRGQGALLESTAYIRTDEAHSLGFRGDGSTVAILDSGVDTDHPSLADAIIHEYHFLDQGANVGPGAEDDHGHGTHVTGIIASRGGEAPPGVAPGVQVIALKVLDSSNVGWLVDWAAGVDHVITLMEEDEIRVDAINMSLVSQSTYGEVCDGQVSFLSNACRSAWEHGITVLAASGNNFLPDELTIPACYSSVISVGSVLDDGSDRISFFTNRGPHLDLLAPGELITSAGLGGGTHQLRGTSQAVPHATALACLLREIDATISPESIHDVLQLTGRPITDETSGRTYPLIDARAALEAWLVPRIRDFQCYPAGEKITTTWAGMTDVDQYKVGILADGKEVFTDHLNGQEAGFNWTPSSTNDYEISVWPLDESGLVGLRATCVVNFVIRRPFIRADCNSDGETDISDPISLLSFLFLGSDPLRCAEACDSNDDELLDVSDAIYSLHFQFMGGAPPPPPGEACGMDPGEADLGCFVSPCP